MVLSISSFAINYNFKLLLLRYLNCKYKQDFWNIYMKTNIQVMDKV